MTETKVIDAVYVQLEDWAGLYLDDKIVVEGNSINLAEWLKDNTVRFFARMYEDADQNYVDNGGTLPPTYDDLLENQYMWEEDNR